jgi:hypothetical protein
MEDHDMVPHAAKAMRGFGTQRSINATKKTFTIAR